MNQFKKALIAGTIATSMIFSTLVLAAPPEPPDGNGGGPGGAPGGAPGGNPTSANVSYTGSTTISESTTESGTVYASTEGNQNALLVSGGTSTITNPTVTKSGDASGDEADFYGTNAAVLTYNDATLDIVGGTITTNGSHANAVFAYGTGTINISNATINTTSNNSGGVMVTGGGTLTANNVTVVTSGNSSASIRSDRGGGTLTVNGGTFETTGVGSPAVYSTANVTVNNATLSATSSEGIVVEGANSVSLNNTTLTDNNTTLNGNSETYKNIFLYQSMSGDADEGTASFTSRGSTITTNNGDTIFVTNTTATISLENNTIVNHDGDFLRIQTGKWGTSGANGGNVTLGMTNQKVEGNIIVDDISTLALSLNSGSVMIGTIDTENQAKNIDLSLSSDSVISLTGDAYVDTLTNEDSNNANIYLNGYKLYVNGEEVSANSGTYDGNAGNNSEAPNDTNEAPENTAPTDETNQNDTGVKNKNYMYYILIGIVAVIVGVIIWIKSKEN
ncbi:MAG: hypothetical protein IJ217_00030 [Clostridia bacterium]|nr:hypothetical protein [Clostridia bacterium]